MPKRQLLPQEVKELNTLVDERVHDSLDMIPAHRLMWRSFLRGAFAGLGGVVGATVMVGVLIWLLHILGGLPVIGRYLNNVQNTIEQKSGK